MPPVHDEVDRLLAELHAHSITFLTGTLDAALNVGQVQHPLPPAELLHRIAASNEPILRDALDVFHFDLYSVALSKIERGAEPDCQDVVVLVRSGRVDPAELDAAFHEILPRIATEGMASMDPVAFEEHYHYLRSPLAP